MQGVNKKATEGLSRPFLKIMVITSIKHLFPSLPFFPSLLRHVFYIVLKKKKKKKIQKQLQEVNKHLENRPSQKWMFWFPNIIEISKTPNFQQKQL